MKTLPTLFLSILCITISYSQSATDVMGGPEWFDGSVLLNNGREIKGLIKYNDKNDIVSIENGRESKSFTARHVNAFEFFDEIIKKQRIFYAIEIDDRFYKVKRPLFFEVLLDLKEFSVLSKISPIHVDKREYATPVLFNSSTGPGTYYGNPSSISYTERIFFLKKSGELRAYLEITEKQIDGLFFDRSVTRNKILDEDVLQRFTSSHYKPLIDFVALNDLNLKEKDGLIRALKFYQELSKK